MRRKKFPINHYIKRFGLKKIVIIICYMLLSLTLMLIFFLTEKTHMKFIEILKEIQDQVINRTGEIDFSEQISKIKLIGYDLINANTLTILITYITILTIGVVLTFYSKVYRRISKYDNFPMKVLENQRSSEVYGHLYNNLLKIKVFLNIKKLYLLDDYLKDLKELLLSIYNQNWGLPSYLLEELNITIEELCLNFEMIKRSHEKIKDPNIDNYLKHLSEIHDILGNEIHQKKMVETYNNRINELMTSGN